MKKIVFKNFLKKLDFIITKILDTLYLYIIIFYFVCVFACLHRSRLVCMFIITFCSILLNLKESVYIIIILRKNFLKYHFIFNVNILCQSVSQTYKGETSLQRPSDVHNIKITRIS